MREIKCEICGEVFTGKDKCNSMALKFKNHLKNEHGLSLEEYATKTFFNGEHPKCACGCGQDVKFVTKLFFRCEEGLALEPGEEACHGFRKYKSCTHVVPPEDRGVKISEAWKQKWNNNEWFVEYVNETYGMDYIKHILFNYQSGLSFKDSIDGKIIDKRTLKNIWLRTGLLTEEEYNKLIIQHQYDSAHLTAIKNNFIDSDDICKQLYDIIHLSPQKYNIRSLITFFNKHNDMDLSIKNPNLVYEKLVKMYSKTEIDSLLHFGSHSKEELEILDVLFFFFKKKNVKCGFTLQYDNTLDKRFCYTYDFCIFNKILIEYDGKGYFHTDELVKQKDKEKELFAINKGFYFIRLTDISAHDINTFVKIKKIIENDKINRN